MMKKIYSDLIIMTTLWFLLMTVFPAARSGAAVPDKKVAGIQKTHALYIPFTENKGPSGSGTIKYYTRTFGGSVAITNKGEILYVFTKDTCPAGSKFGVIKESFLGGSCSGPRGEGMTGTRINNFKGRNPACWKTGLATYRTVTLGEVYQGIEIKIKAAGDNLEKLFYVRPSAAADKVRVAVEGAAGLHVNTRGELEAAIGTETITFTKPLAYQEESGQRKPVAVAYVVQGTTYGFSVGAYDRSKELVIDPLLASTFLGGASDSERSSAMTLDSSGNVYVTGYTRSIDFPTTPGSYSESRKDASDIFIAKFDGKLENLLAATFYGGESDDESSSIALDTSGNVYVTGETGSDDLPTTPTAYQPEHRSGRVGTDAYIAKFDGELKSLLAATYLSGSDGGAEDTAHGIAIGGSGNVYVVGRTDAPNFPVTAGAYDTNHGASPDAINPSGRFFISKLDNNLALLQASTFFGVLDSSEVHECIAVDAGEQIIVAGETVEAAYPTTQGAYDTTFNNPGSYQHDIYISKFDSNLHTLVRSTFLGGSDSDSLGQMVLDSSGNVCLTGTTGSEDFPVTAGAYDVIKPEYGKSFICKFDNNLEKLLASTFHCNKAGGAIALDASGNICIAGSSEYGCPTPLNAYQTEEDDWGGAYIAKFDSMLEKLLAATFLGGSERDTAAAVAADSSGNIYVTGWTESSNFPVSTGAYDTTFNSAAEDEDVFIAKFNGDLTAQGGTTTSIPIENCPLATTVHSTVTLNRLRELRDLRLQTGPAADLVGLYYRNASEISALLMQNPVLKTKLADMINGNMKSIKALLANGEVTVNRQSVAEWLNFLDQLHNAGGSLQIQKSIERAIDRLRDNAFLFKIGLRVK